METQNKIANQKYVPMKEMILFFVGTFLLTNLQGVVNTYRQAYLLDVLVLDPELVGKINGFCTIAAHVLSFFITLYIDRTPKPGKPKFIGHVKWWTIPTAIFAILHFYTPEFVLSNDALIFIYMAGITLVYGVANQLSSQINSIAVVISPNNDERDTALTFRGIVNAIGNSAPLVVIMVVGLFTKDEGLKYIILSIVCSFVAVIFMLLAAKVVKERVTYSQERQNPLVGFVHIIKNKYARIVLISEFLKNFRKIASYMGIFLAAALLGSKDKYLLFGLPTGIGTFVGMLIVKAFLKKFNSKQIYIASGVYSIIANTLAFVVGVVYFKTGASVLQIVFIICLFLVGLQFGASNLLPSMFQADILEDIEVQTHKRLDASLGFVIGIGATVSGAIANYFSPIVLAGEGSIIGYLQPVEGEYPEQSMDTKIRLLFFYTVVHGIMMFLAGVPFFFYKLTGKKREEVHAAAIAYRESLGK